MSKRYATAKHPLKVLIRMFSYLKYHKLMTVIVICIAFLNVGISLFGTFMLKPVIDDYIDPALNGLISYNQLLTSLMTISLILFGIYIASFCLAVLQTLLMIKLAQYSVNKIREDLFVRIQDLPLKYFDKVNSGETMSSFTNDLNLVDEAFTNSFLEILTSSVLVLGILIMLFVVNWLLGLIVVVLLPIMILLIKRFIKIAHKNFDATQKSMGEMNGYVEEVFFSQKIIKSFNKEDDVEREFNVILERMTNESIKSSFYSHIGIPVVKNYSTIILVVCIIVGVLLSSVYKIDWLPMSIGSLSVFLTFINQLYRPLNRTTNQLNIVQAALAGIERVFGIIDLECEKRSDEQYSFKKIDGKYYWVNGEEKVEARGEVIFDHVSFGYKEGEIVLDDISFIAKPGQKISLVGQTGSGKTTIISLLTKFYDINSGNIFVDGINIRDIDYKDLRYSISLVLQNTDLFSKPLIENIRFGRLEASDDECIESLKLVHADKFVDKLTNGYYTLLNGADSILSIGQKQLLAIARVAMKDSPILILDEATSSIDTRTEMLINSALDKVVKGKTFFVIAHRLSTARNSDLIIVIEKGRIIESGTNAELMKKKGKFYNLCLKQEVE